MIFFRNLSIRLSLSTNFGNNGFNFTISKIGLRSIKTNNCFEARQTYNDNSIKFSL